MQHPVGHALGQAGALRLVDFGAFLFNPWAVAAYLHNMAASAVTASFGAVRIGVPSSAPARFSRV